MLNYSQNPRRRFDFTVGIDPAHSIRQAQTLALEAYSHIDGVLEDPAPSWTVVQNAPTGVDLQFFGWVDQHHSDLGTVRSESTRLVNAAFTLTGIHHPRTAYHVVTSRHAASRAAHAAVGPPPTAYSHTSDKNRKTS